MKRMILTIAITSILTTGCSTYYYMPTSPNIPLFKKEKELQVKGGIDDENTNFQLGYSVGKHFGIIANGLWSKYDKTTMSRYFVEAAAGYNHRFLKYGVVELYGGYGQGEINIPDPNSYRKIERYFLQPSIGFSSAYFDLAFTPRISAVYYNTNKNLYFINEEPLPGEKYSFFEPCVTARAGYKWVKLQAQYNTAQMTGGTVIPYFKSSLSLMLLVTVPLSK